MRWLEFENLKLNRGSVTGLWFLANLANVMAIGFRGSLDLKKTIGFGFRGSSTLRDCVRV